MDSLTNLFAAAVPPSALHPSSMTSSGGAGLTARAATSAPTLTCAPSRTDGPVSGVSGETTPILSLAADAMALRSAAAKCRKPDQPAHGRVGCSWRRGRFMLLADRYRLPLFPATWDLAGCSPLGLALNSDLLHS